MPFVRVGKALIASVDKFNAKWTGIDDLKKRNAATI
jgi:hypothetical protein